MSAEDMLALYVSLLNLSLKVYPDKLDYIDQVYNNATTLLAKLKEDGYVCYAQSVAILILTNHFSPVLTTRRRNASDISKACLTSRCLSTTTFLFSSNWRTTLPSSPTWGMPTDVRLLSTLSTTSFPTKRAFLNLRTLLSSSWPSSLFLRMRKTRLKSIRYYLLICVII